MAFKNKLYTDEKIEFYFTDFVWCAVDHFM